MRTLWHNIGRDSRLVMISYMLWGVGEGLWMFIQPLYLKVLGASPTQAGFVIGMWGLGRLLFILPTGIIADRIGARRLMLPGWYLGLAGVVIIALAPDWRWAAPGFLVYGMSAIAIPMTNLYLTQSIRHDPTRKPEVPLQASLTLLWAAYSLGIVVTPSIGGWIGDHISLRAVFLLSSFWFLASIITIRKIAHYPTPERPPRGYKYRELLWRLPVQLAFGLILFGLVAVLTGQTLSSQYLEEIYAFSRTSIGVLGSINALGTAIFSVMLGQLAVWRGFFSSLLVVAFSFVLLLLTGFWPVVALATFMLGAHYAARPLAVSVISTYVAEHQRGMAYALVDTLAGGATLIGTNLAGVLYGRHPDLPFSVGGIGVVVLALVGVALLRRPTLRTADAAPAYGSVKSVSK